MGQIRAAFALASHSRWKRLELWTDDDDGKHVFEARVHFQAENGNIHVVIPLFLRLASDSSSGSTIRHLRTLNETKRSLPNTYDAEAIIVHCLSSSCFKTFQMVMYREVTLETVLCTLDVFRVERCKCEMDLYGRCHPIISALICVYGCMRVFLFSGIEEAVSVSCLFVWTRTSVSSARLAHAAEEHLRRVRMLAVEMSGRFHPMDSGNKMPSCLWHGM